jgi:hypothetical protein
MTNDEWRMANGRPRGRLPRLQTAEEGWNVRGDRRLALLIVGCAHEVSHTSKKSSSSNGTVKSTEKTIAQSSDGTVTTTEETKKATRK